MLATDMEIKSKNPRGRTVTSHVGFLAECYYARVSSFSRPAAFSSWTIDIVVSDSIRGGNLSYFSTASALILWLGWTRASLFPVRSVPVLARNRYLRVATRYAWHIGVFGVLAYSRGTWRRWKRFHSSEILAQVCGCKRKAMIILLYL